MWSILVRGSLGDDLLLIALHGLLNGQDERHCLNDIWIQGRSADAVHQRDLLRAVRPKLGFGAGAASTTTRCGARAKTKSSNSCEQQMQKVFHGSTLIRRRRGVNTSLYRKNRRRRELVA